MKRGSKVDGKSFEEVIPAADQFAETSRKKDNQKTDEEQKKGSGIDGKSFGEVIPVANEEQAKNVEKKDDGEQEIGTERDDNMSTGSNDGINIPPATHKTATVTDAFDPKIGTVNKGLRGVEERKEEAEAPLDEEEGNNKNEKEAKGRVEEYKEEYDSEEDTSAKGKDSTSHSTQSQILKEKQNSNETALALKSLQVTLGLIEKDGKVNDNAESNDNEVVNDGIMDGKKEKDDDVVMQIESETKEVNDADTNNLTENIEQVKTNEGKEDQIIEQVKKGGESGTNNGRIS